ncbi:MAG: NAD(+)/NADH kinase, partial [Sphingomonadales bacterium]
MKQIAIYAKKVSKADVPVFEALLSGIVQLGWQPLLENELALQLQNKFQWPQSYAVFETHNDLKSNVDLMISVGGDGTFLKAVSFVRDSNVPILGINTGRLGFLSNLSKDQIGQTLERFAAGHYEFQKRSLLRVHTENELFGD